MQKKKETVQTATCLSNNWTLALEQQQRHFEKKTTKKKKKLKDLGAMPKKNKKNPQNRKKVKIWGGEESKRLIFFC